MLSTAGLAERRDRESALTVLLARDTPRNICYSTAGSNNQNSGTNPPPDRY